ncbi:hypothetical protein H0H81_012701 [Sphagnurus paluster]|uniref:PRELI/MSF1 domain-containing protein n=1 Tax=Sphagnurus paluster TaxID=117069 RepID=A0A9P7GMQ5_9AGAR|nr:hypothetical protein H0H81_012701 [Sphagnurus paluster]
MAIGAPAAHRTGLNGHISTVQGVELVFLGTGTSSSLPHIECLTASPEEKQCKTCLSTLTPEGKKNIRRNTSAAFRMTAKDGGKVTIVIDAGKNFQASALEWFPKYGLRRIDALLITHPHADAMNGLDDLRGWTLGNAIQSHIDVYVSQETFVEVQRSFPYLVAKEFASGGGDVPEFKWHIINDSVPFEIQDTGIQVTPFSVHHGRIFSVAPPPAYIPSPSVTTPSTPTKTTVALPSKLLFAENAIKKAEEEVVHPYFCYGFKIGHEVVYMSDVSSIPDDKWAIIESPRPNDTRLPVLVVDCLRLRPHTSHFGLEGAVETARRIRASRTYLVGFGHEVSHDEYVRLGEAVGGKSFDAATLTEMEKRGLEMIRKGENVWVRPAHDGLRVFVETNGQRGALPRWAQNIVGRAESWVLEESEVDPLGKTVRCRTKNLDHIKVMQVEEWVMLRHAPDGKTLQQTEARIRSGFGWGLTKKIENHGLTRFKANVQRSREGVSLILNLIRQSRLQPMTLGGAESHSPILEPTDNRSVASRSSIGIWARLKSWVQPPSPT